MRRRCAYRWAPAVLLGALGAFRGGWAAEDSPSLARWEKDIAAFEQSDQQAPPPRGAILFVGSSSIRLWKTLAQDFPKHRVINRGFGGSEIADATQFASRIVVPYGPRQIVMYAGGNDLHNGKSAEQVAADFRAFVTTVRPLLPEVKVAYISIAGNPARWSEIDRVRQANRLIADYCAATPGLVFIDTQARMLGPDGLPRPELFVEDRLHMNEAGYRLWTEIVGPHLTPEPR